jgi:spore germination protein YaaH
MARAWTTAGRTHALPALALLLGCASACAAPGPGRVTPTTGQRYFVAGYHAYWTGASWEAYPWDVLDRLYFFEIEVGADGSLADFHGWPEEWSGLVARARDAGVSLVPTISMHDADAFEELFASPERAARLVSELSAMLSASPELDGIHLDLEVFRPVDIAVRDGYTAFVASLDRALDALSSALSLSVFAMAFDDDDVYNERALAELADYLVVQGYDFHHTTDARAGPLGATEGWGRLSWASVLERFLSLGVPARKLVMAVPFFGYEWPVVGPEPGSATRGDAVIVPLAPADDVVPELPRAFARAAEHGVRRDADSGVPYYAYQDDSGWRQGWFEDAESRGAKYAFVREHGLGGVALFPLAYGDATHWQELRTAFSLPRGGAPPGTPR